MSLEIIANRLGPQLLLDELLSGDYWLFRYDTTLFTVHKYKHDIHLLSVDNQDMIAKTRLFFRDVWKTTGLYNLYATITNKRVETLAKYFKFEYLGVDSKGHPLYIKRRM